MPAKDRLTNAMTDRNKEETMSAKEKARAIRKVEIAIDKLIDAQDLGLADDSVQRALDSLNSLLARLRS
jgi:hypothetical protein